MTGISTAGSWSFALPNMGECYGLHLNNGIFLMLCHSRKEEEEQQGEDRGTRETCKQWERTAMHRIICMALHFIPPSIHAVIVHNTQ
ncbi:hypothetical protein CEXT_44621 [Caerostris extrusa]|uniref:Uncharacterized protein n=1 Tax=Caerostris extrusa TaxID=172846 RepID=A0AAV4QND7_CAEEX|nr:hypothetical protein CEXT_44621 [Caerostris extrusa]